ncbi:MAG: GvpL/GvpF family gas vesicle protein, partial [Candidatus Aerophobetes bacterium]|nr:GvpL/GvpF family gas vesicle protein [Candidatus Aerophobetes bacterium]
VFWQKEAMIAWIAAKNKGIAKIKEKIKTLSPDKAEPLLIEAGQLVKSLVDKWREKYYSRVYRKLMRVAVDGRYNPPISVENLLNASFLVDKDKEKQFDNLIDKLDSEYGEMVNFKVVKPVSPYNFVDVKLYLKEVL